MSDIRSIDTGYKTGNSNESIFYNKRTGNFSIEIQQQELKSVTEEELEERVETTTTTTTIPETAEKFRLQEHL